jgi:hypothetical protein
MGDRFDFGIPDNLNATSCGLYNEVKTSLIPVVGTVYFNIMVKKNGCRITQNDYTVAL